LLQNTAVLGNRLGPILFQLPPNMEKDVQRLRGFLGLLPPKRRFTIEFRHESWFDDEIYSALREHDVAMCLNEQAEFACPVHATASWGYVRLHRLTMTLRRWASGPYRASGVSNAYVYFKHDGGVGSGPPAVGAFPRSERGGDGRIAGAGHAINVRRH
jgi:uncharacterized protein YecE (DUF72 family)